MSTESTPAIQARGLGRRFGRHWALAHVDLEVAPGEVWLVAGANGSGKTTLLRLLSGLSRPTRGRVEIFGRDPQEHRTEARRALSMVSHSSYLYPHLTALETVRLWSRLLGASRGDGLLEEYLGSVGLLAARHERVGGYSAGMRKRLGLARILLEEPRVVLLDEPFASLDADGKRMVERWIERLSGEGVAIVMVSHSLQRAAAICERGLLLQEGQPVWQGSAEGLLRRVGDAT